MINKVTLTGAYTGVEERGIIIGGKSFLPKYVQTTDVNEDVFLNLREGEKNGWFKINKDNYSEFLASRGRAIEVVAIKEEFNPADVKIAEAATVIFEGAGEVKTDEVKTDEVKTDEVKTDEVKTGEVKTDEVKPARKPRNKKAAEEKVEE